MFPAFTLAGDAAILVQFGDRIDLEINQRAHALARRIAAQPLDGVGEAVPGYSTLLVHFDPLLLDAGRVLSWIQDLSHLAADEALPAPRRVDVPVHYGGDHGPDLAYVAEHCRMTPAEVIRWHTSGEYPVYFLGFTPGFPYLGGLDPRLATPRLATPRTLVPAGSVGIAGPQTGIYSVASPGGWRLIGWTPLKLFDPSAEPPALLAPGDVVVFRDATVNFLTNH